jgi:hypothetical protein
MYTFPKNIVPKITRRFSKIGIPKARGLPFYIVYIFPAGRALYDAPHADMKIAKHQQKHGAQKKGSEYADPPRVFKILHGSVALKNAAE